MLFAIAELLVHICGGALLPKKVDDLFLVVTFKRTLNVQTSKQRGKNLAADRRGALATGGPHGTTGTMDNPALYPCISPSLPDKKQLPSQSCK